jgi:hypothetical protein
MNLFFIAFDWPYIIYYILYIIYHIFYIIYHTLYMIYKYNILYYIIHTLYYTIPHCAPTDSTMQWEVDFLSKHFMPIFSICFFLDNDYGTIICFKLVLPNISLNMNVLKIKCTISKLAFKVLCLTGKCYKW